MLTTRNPKEPQWVSDELFFVVDKQNELEIHKWNGTEEYTLNVIRRPLGDVSVTISPDGRFIQTVVITTNANNDRVQLYSVASIETGKDVLNESAMNRFVAWLPDSSGFTYIDDEGGISLYDLSDNTIQQLVGNRYFSPQYPLSSAFSSLMWSSTGRYLAYRQYNAGGTNPENYVLSVFDMEIGESHSIMGMVSTWAGQIHWVSSTQLVYTYADAKAGFPPPREQNNLWLYDVETGENTQLTDTPELNEQFNCAWG